MRALARLADRAMPAQDAADEAPLVREGVARPLLAQVVQTGWLLGELAAGGWLTWFAAFQVIPRLFGHMSMTAFVLLAPLAAVGALGQAVDVVESGESAPGRLFPMAVFFYATAVALAAYAHAYVGPRSVRPWEPQRAEALDEEVRVRAEDRLTKWNNLQKQIATDERHFTFAEGRILECAKQQSAGIERLDASVAMPQQRPVVPPVRVPEAHRGGPNENAGGENTSDRQTRTLDHRPVRGLGRRRRSRGARLVVVVVRFFALLGTVGVPVVGVVVPDARGEPHVGRVRRIRRDVRPEHPRVVHPRQREPEPTEVPEPAREVARASRRDALRRVDGGDVRFAVVVKWHAHRVALSESRTSRSRDWRSAKSPCSATSESASGEAEGVGGVADITAREANILGAGGIAGRSTDPPAR